MKTKKKVFLSLLVIALALLFAGFACSLTMEGQGYQVVWPNRLFSIGLTWSLWLAILEIVDYIGLINMRVNLNGWQKLLVSIGLLILVSFLALNSLMSGLDALDAYEIDSYQVWKEMIYRPYQTLNSWMFYVFIAGTVASYFIFLIFKKPELSSAENK